ncbi:MAG: hypothetical protein KC609_11240 [Myxococcales bacterium]|nr:hypothetical protein [Myxococcales bacterium]
MGFLIRILAKTRLRLVISALVSSFLAIGVSLLALGFIRESSQSTVIDFFLITGWLLLCFFNAFIVAILAGDLIFGSTWRERNILSRAFRLPSAESDDAAFIKEEIRDHTFAFSVFILIALFAIVYATNEMNGGFLSYYQEQGYVYTLLRSPKASNRTRAVLRIAEVPDERLRILMKAVLEHVDDPHPEVRRAALWAIGIYADRMVRALLIHQANDRESMHKHWEYDVYTKDIKELFLPRIVDAVKRRRGLERREAILALGRLGDKKSLIVLFEQELNRRPTRVSHEDLQQMVIATAFSRHIEGMDLILKFIRYAANRDNDTILYGVWALGELGRLGKPGPDKLPPDEIRRAVAFLDTAFFDLTFEQQCVALDALRKIQHPRLVVTLIKAFRKAAPQAICRRRELKRRGMAPVLMVAGESFRIKVLNTLSMMVNGQVIDFLREVIADTKLTGDLRDRARLILSRLKSR